MQGELVIRQYGYSYALLISKTSVSDKELSDIDLLFIDEARLWIAINGIWKIRYRETDYIYIYIYILRDMSYKYKNIIHTTIQ